MTNILFKEISSNRKTGPIAVTYSNSTTCPDVCPLKGNGCYAETGRTAIHWKSLNSGKLAKSHLNWDEFLLRVKELRKGSLMRHNVAGDLPGENNIIDRVMFRDLIDSCRRISAFSFTHKPVGWGDINEHPMMMRIRASNTLAVKEANAKVSKDGYGMTVNISTDSLEQADYIASLNIGPVVSVVSSDSPRHMKTPEGRHVITCPNEFDPSMTCDKCQLCIKPNRKAIIAFRSHGIMKNKVNARIKRNNDKKVYLNVIQL